MEKENKTPRPNGQYYGLGIIGKGQDGSEFKVKWGFCNPPLIPYFDERGVLFHLRPHKGMMKGKSPELYIPRASLEFRKSALEFDPPVPMAWWEEEFKTVIVTEGEFKAGAVWQVLGQGQFQFPEEKRKPPLGICAIPGIQQAKNFRIRAELEAWLEKVKCQEVVVSFDNENKGDPMLPGYKVEEKKRYDSIIWARFLAIDLERTMRRRGHSLTAYVATLPDQSRDEKGKADWDGVLARRIRELLGRVI